MSELLRLTAEPELHNPALIVGWTADAGKIGSNVINYLTRRFPCENFGSIDPVEFYPLNGATIENDLIQFPESKFYACTKSDLLLFESYPPTSEWFQFLSLILDVAGRYRVRELYVVGGMISLAAHTTPREVMGTCNSIEIKRALESYDVVSDLNYETPPSQKPTLNSFLLWAAQKRGISAISIWIPVPFYLVNIGDYLAQKIILQFFNRRFGLEIDLSDISEAVNQQNVKIAEARNKISEIDNFINKLESNLKLTDEENQKLLFEMDDYLK